ncbi:uncharacterized protein LOC132310422 [Cornus florida]|uniref:uncharacterized protein LOC132310422 n=1 Tax=Cornus florida TaxID=4283 RepID=UPI00289A24A8|nr:uncharacterized protein LOC132310422 [Cornus florida]
MKNKLMLCFRPIVPETEIESDGNDCSHGRVSSTYISVANHKDLKRSKFKSPSPDHKNSRNSEGKSNSRRFLKAVLFVISLKKRVRERKVHQLTFQSNTGDLENPKSLEANIKHNKRNLSVSSSSSSCSSSFSSSERNNFRSLSYKKCMSRSLSDLLDQKKPSIGNPQDLAEVKSKNSILGNLISNWGLCLILIILSITMIWGRVCAILLASMCFYFLPCRSKFNPQSEKMAAKWPAVNMEYWSRDYNKRVIMEGLLERNRHEREH